MKNKCFVIMQSTGFPFTISASNEKFKMIGRSLQPAGYDVFIFSKYLNSQYRINKINRYGKIFFFAPLGFDKLAKKINKLFLFPFGFLKECLLIIKLSKKYENMFLLISYSSVFFLLTLWILKKIYRIKIIVSIMEYHPALAKNWYSKFKSYFFDNYSFMFSDAALPISTFLMNMIKKKYHSLPAYKLPIITDFDYIELLIKNKLHSDINDNYFLYCGSASYNHVIDFVVESFLKLKDDKIKLLLVLSGKDSDVFEVTDKYKRIKSICIYSKLSFQKLIEMYSDAIALLVPLRSDNLQDKARFPHKIGEYLASGRPIISNSFGEISEYFKDGINAFVTEKYETFQYLEKMKFCISNPDIADNVGKRGKEFGRSNFHYLNYSDKLDNFLMNI